MNPMSIVPALLACALTSAAAAQVRVDVIKNPYGGSRNVPELSTNPDYIHAAGLERLIAGWGGELIRPIQDVRLDAEQEKQYGEWNRMALANANFAEIVREGLQDDTITIGLEANCNDLLGMLSGLKYDSDGNARRVGLVFYDSHGDFNVPETTLSGMLGGMPVAIAAGHALHNLRRTTGLKEPLPMRHIMWGGVRDLDPLEDRFREYEVRQVSVQDIRDLSDNFDRQFAALAGEVDVIYVHVDMDVLEPDEVPGHGLAVPDGPSSEALARAIGVMFRNPKTVALGIASTPSFNRDPDGVSRRAALRLIEGAIVLLAAAALAQTAAPDGRWVLASGEDPDTGEAVATLEQDALTTIKDEYATKDVTPKLVLRCVPGSGEISARIDWQRFISSFNTEVGFKVDAGKTLWQKWAVDRSNRLTLSRSASDAEALLEALGSGDSLTVEVTPYSEAPVTVGFSLAGLEASLGRLAAECG